MKIEKKEALKSLWAAIEDTIKALKALAENPVVPSVSHLWDSFNSYQSGVRFLTTFNISLDKFYKVTTYNKDYIIFKTEYFVIFKTEYFVSNDRGIGLKVKVLTSKESFNYSEVKDDIIVTNDLFNNNFEEIEINPQDLPLYIGNEFLGSLFKELMTEAGLPIPESPKQEE